MKEPSRPQTVIWHSLQVEAATHVASTWQRCASLPSGGGVISRRCAVSRFPPRFVCYSSHLERVRGECSVVDVHGSSAARLQLRRGVASRYADMNDNGVSSLLWGCDGAALADHLECVRLPRIVPQDESSAWPHVATDGGRSGGGPLYRKRHRAKTQHQATTSAPLDLCLYHRLRRRHPVWGEMKE